MPSSGFLVLVLCIFLGYLGSNNLVFGVLLQFGLDLSEHCLGSRTYF